MTRIDTNGMAWPMTRAADALEALAKHCGMTTRPEHALELPEAHCRDATVRARFIRDCGSRLGIETERLSLIYADLATTVPTLQPALFVIPGDRPSLLAISDARRGRLQVLTPSLSTYSMTVETLRSLLAQHLETAAAAEAYATCATLPLTDHARARLERILVARRLHWQPIEDAWSLRVPPTASLRSIVTRARGRLVSIALASVMAQASVITGWWLLGRGALSGRLDRGLILAWAIAYFALWPLLLFAAARLGTLAITSAAVVREKLLVGALRVPPDSTRAQGAGQALGQVLETRALDATLVSSMVSVAVALAELISAGVVLAVGAGGAWHALALMAWSTLAVAVIGATHRRRRAWVDERRTVMNDLIERMGGHRTRLAQEPRAQWHVDEDRMLDTYYERGRKLDQTLTRAQVLIPLGWFVLALSVLGPALTFGGSSIALATSVGGIYLAYFALEHLVHAFNEVSGGWISWTAMQPLLRAVNQRPTAGLPELGLPFSAPAPPNVLLHGHALTFSFPSRPHHAALRHVTFELRAGDRVLVEGASGAGKSTWAQLIAGLRSPTNGVLLLRGFDRASIGDEAWRREVAVVPQFHDNYVVSGTLLFNLLMGRQWPADQKDRLEAREVCDALGLGPLLDRMPSGLDQQVGETGWQLSHGERSRIYLARALLQRATILVLDESFAALDPATLHQALDVVMTRAQTLVVIAHP